MNVPLRHDTEGLEDLPLHAAQEALHAQEESVPDRAEVAEEVQSLELTASDLVRLERLENDMQFDQAAEIHRTAGELIKRAEGVLRPVVDAQHKAHRAALGALKELTAGPQNVKRLTSRLMGEYQARKRREAEEERKRLEAEARQQEEERREREAEAALAAGDDEGALAILDEPEAPVPVVPVAEAPKAEGFRTVERWGFEVRRQQPPATWEEVARRLSNDDIGAITQALRRMFGVEPAYLIPDEKQIGAEVRALKDARRVEQIIGPAVVATKSVTTEATGR